MATRRSVSVGFELVHALNLAREPIRERIMFGESP